MEATQRKRSEYGYLWDQPRMRRRAPVVLCMECGRPIMPMEGAWHVYADVAPALGWLHQGCRERYEAGSDV